MGITAQYWWPQKQDQTTYYQEIKEILKALKIDRLASGSLANKYKQTLKMKCLTIFSLCLQFLLFPLSGRTWTDTKGRQIDADYVSATNESVKLRRTSDMQYFTIPLNTLSYEDQEFVRKKNQVTPTRRVGFNSNNGNTSRFATNTTAIQPEPLGNDVQANRLKIPSLGYDELGRNYPSGPSCFVNFLVWWGDELAPATMPRNDRDKSIEEIAEDLGDYFRDDSNTMKAMIKGIMQYSEKKMKKGHDLNLVASIAAPSEDELNKWVSDWYGVVALFGFYEERGGRLHRETGRYTSFVEVSDESSIHNLMGKQFILTNAPNGKVDSSQVALGNYENYLSPDGSPIQFLQYENANQRTGSFIPEGAIALLEQIVVFEIREMPETED